jgi:hypothetical protein
MVTSPVTVTDAATGKFLRASTFVAAIALATVSGGFSITGLTSIFVGAPGPVMIMGVALELGKLTAVAWLGRTTFAYVKVPLGVLVAILMGLNAIGCYGFLAKAQIGHAVAGEASHGARLADVDGKIAVQENAVASLDKQLNEIHGRINRAIELGKVNGAAEIASNERQNLTRLQVDRLAQARLLADLKVERAKIVGEKLASDADLGPVRYLAVLMGAGDQDVLRWFILVVALLLDPAAVLLLLAATKS